MKNTNLSIRFGLRIKELRKSKGLSQEDFADLCELDRTYISGIERGKRNPSLNALEILAKALNISIGELFSNL
ncbi:helix-turn-helix domain-containing protein [Methyloradius palustris]|uniref:helix-turn-helix domain-containing protein n=1 Tax=Methyloradius palustris TaxID=2778876 RepID=UPI001C8BC9AA|nr:helix-turn-helix transcriptional regulator [Methyloradius palustris]